MFTDPYIRPLLGLRSLTSILSLGLFLSFLAIAREQHHPHSALVQDHAIVLFALLFAHCCIVDARQNLSHAPCVRNLEYDLTCWHDEGA